MNMFAGLKRQGETASLARRMAARWSLNGQYDDQGYWRKNKYCFVSCGSRCDCGPPGGLYYSAAHDKRLDKINGKV